MSCMGRVDMKMKQTNREELSWIQGVIIGITASMGEDDMARREVLRSVARVIESMLHDAEEEDHETESC